MLRKICLSLAVLFATLLLAVSCGRESPEDSSIEWGDEMPPPAKIPGVGAITDCDEPDNERDPEEWACIWHQSFDAVIVAGIDAVNIEHSPSMIARSDYPNELLDECEEGLVEPVISLDVTVLEAARGDLEPGDTLTVRFGGARTWSPYPLDPTINGVDADDPSIDPDEIEEDDLEWHVLDEYFSPGTHVGLGLYHHTDPAEAWSPTLNSVFFFGEDGLDYQNGAFQCSESPWKGLSFEEYEEALNACPEMEVSDTRRDRIKENATENPDNYIAANCFVAD